MATYGYLRCYHRLCQKGDGLFIQESMQRIQENRVNMGSLSSPSYLFFHSSDSGQIWYLLKAVIKEYPTLPRARRMKADSWRTLEVLGLIYWHRCGLMVPSQSGWTFDGLPPCPSRVLLQFTLIFHEIWNVFEVKE